MNLNYGKINITGSSSYVGLNIGIPSFYNLGDENGPTEYKQKKNEQKAEYITVSIHPSFQYYFSNKVGLTLGLGGIEYGKILDSDEKIWAFAFSPSFWSLGFNIKI